jgi:hypothetical protein
MDQGLYYVGIINSAAMREFDILCSPLEKDLEPKKSSLRDYKKK